MGQKRMCVIAYADDIVLLAMNEEVLKEMMIKLKKYLEKNKLKLSEEKSKIMVFKKAGGREKRVEVGRKRDRGSENIQVSRIHNEKKQWK